MKSNFLRLSYFAIAAAGMLTACNQENVSSDMANSGNVLSISVSQNDFSPVDAESRAVTNLTNRTTTFENGDKLGLYVVSNADGSYHYENVPFTYNGESWESESASTIYYYKNSDYIVYYPYIEDLQLTVGETGVSGAIKTVFESKSDFYTQNTADAYEAVDLMMAEVENPSDANVTFNLAHKFSMIEISVPVRKYITERTYNDEKFEYNAPVKLEWTSPLAYGDNEVTPYAAGKGVYRFIVKPGTDVAVNIDGYVQYEEEPFNFSNNNAALTLTEGSFKHYKVTVDGISNDVTVRDLEVGDYYYSDGSIYPYGNQEGDNDLNNPMVEGCIGVIYQVADHTYGDNERTAVVGVNGTEWIHGNVIALEDLQGDKIAWGSHSTGLEGNIYSGTDENSHIDINFVTDMRGYELSHNDNLRDEASVKSALDYTKEYPSTSSGWYLPSAGQMMMLWINLGEYNLNMNDDLMIGDNNLEDQKDDCYTKLLSHFTAIGSSLGNVQQWWTVTENYDSGANQNKAWPFKINTQYNNGDKTGFLDRKKDTNQAVVRPVLSF